MVPPSSHGIPRVPWYSGYTLHIKVFAYRTFTFCGGVSQLLRLTCLCVVRVLTPEILLLPVWPLPRSLATTCGISVDFSSSPYLDVSVQAVPFLYLSLRFQQRIRRYCLRGFPHSEICGSMCVCHSPQLIAACHVLLRLLVPRHSPCALYSLTYRDSFPESMVKLCGFSIVLLLSPFKIVDSTLN